MRKWTKFLAVFAIAVTVGVAAKADFASAAQISGVHQTDARTNSVGIAWDADLSVNAASNGKYRVEISQDKSSWVQSDIGSSTTAGISNLSAGKSYYVRVAGYSDSGCTNMIAEPSEPFEVVTVPDMSNMKASQSDAATSSYSVSFSDVTGANWYIIEENDMVLGSSSKPTVKVSGCNPGTRYSFGAYACRKSESGFIAHYSYDRVYTSAKTLTKQPAVSQFGITNIWYNINSYKVEVSNTVGEHDGVQFQFATIGGKVKKNVTTSSNYSYLDSFINGTFYKYRARTYVNCGTTNKYSAWSPYRTIALPKSMSFTATSKKVIKLNWSKISGATGYDVYVSNKQNSGYKKVKSLSASNRSIAITKYGKKALKKGAKYYVRVIPKGKSGKSTIKAQIYYSGYVSIPIY